MKAGRASKAGGGGWAALAAVLVGVSVLASPLLMAQQPPRTPRAAAPIDLTGTWVSVVTEDWRWRMVVPQKGDYSSVPLSPEGRKVADTWDPSKLATDGCRPYGAAAVMRVPGRVKVSWDGDDTLKIETDAGAQTRWLRFASAAPGRPEGLQPRTSGRPEGLQPRTSGLQPRTSGLQPRTSGLQSRRSTAASWQGTSIAEWEQILSPGGLGVSLQQAPPRQGTLKVTTTNLRAGYLRKNGVPYSESTTMTEYFDRVTAAGHDWLTVYTVVQDPKYLSQPFITSTHFKREADAAKWSPSPCERRS